MTEYLPGADVQPPGVRPTGTALKSISYGSAGAVRTRASALSLPDFAVIVPNAPFGFAAAVNFVAAPLSADSSPAMAGGFSFDGFGCGKVGGKIGGRTPSRAHSAFTSPRRRPL